MSYKKQIHILVTGTPGVGKSTLVDAFAGKPVTKRGSQLLNSGSKDVLGHEVTAEEGVEVVVWDSPGLVEGDECLAELKEKCSNVSVIVYCIDISATRSSGLTSAEIPQNDISAINKLTFTFGPSWWKRSVFAMTRANVLESALKVKPDLEKRFNDKLQEWKERIFSTLIKSGVPKEVAYKIPVRPAGHPKKPHLPGRENWRRDLWRVVIGRATPSTTNVIPTGGEFNQLSSPAGIAARVGLVAASVAGLGAVVGCVGGPAGAAVGGAVGGALGFAAGIIFHVQRA